MSDRKGFSSMDFSLFLATVLWGSDSLFAKISIPLSFAAICTLISTAVMFAIFLRQKKEWRLRRILCSSAASSFCLSCRTNSYLTPIRAILFAVPFLGETLTTGQIWGI